MFDSPYFKITDLKKSKGFTINSTLDATKN